MSEHYIPFAVPDLDRSELEKIQEVLESGWITCGPRTQEFEAEFAASVGAKHAVAVNSCTAAMHLSLEAIGLQRDDEVITTPYTFAATAEVVRYFEAKPVFVDICADDFNMDARALEAAVTQRSRVILPVHIAGLPADTEAIERVAARYDLAVVEDAAHAFPSRRNGRSIGQALPSVAAGLSVPHCTCFSFYATKTITTGEGGMITTDDDVLAERCRIMSLHGISRDAWKRYSSEGSWYYEILSPGFKYNMTDIAAAMGLAQLAKAEQMWRRRCEIARLYNDAFGTLPQLQIPCDRHGDQHSWHLYMLRLNLDRLSIGRNDFVDRLKENGVGASVHFIPLHLHPYYRQTYGYEPTDFPVAYREYLREISLPIYSKMTTSDACRVIDCVLDIIKKHER